MRPLVCTVQFFSCHSHTQIAYLPSHRRSEPPGHYRVACHHQFTSRMTPVQHYLLTCCFGFRQKVIVNVLGNITISAERSFELCRVLIIMCMTLESTRCWRRNFARGSANGRSKHFVCLLAMVLTDGPTMDLQPFNIQITYNHSLCKREILHRTLEPPTLFRPLICYVCYI